MSAILEHPTVTAVADDTELLDEQLTELRALAQQDSVTEDQIYDFSIRWGTVLAGRLRRLAHYGAVGLLDAADEVGFQNLRHELNEVSNLIDQFKLSRPRLAESACPRRHHIWM
ncbi:hypothetical protein [Mycobacterium riyadhense]|uniref:Uncharacterized protein n=1 Tax=Mycobacterium riyadhense TaxID=486698 RepID=A0A1X2CZH2_9MYCO|nr:hypothetical protein [Mycobacterium riyadhense]MCV7144445.1 hypothetical protein [Mycobacterium riyadhense]ORW81347.1 hypothetical protein AWC22_16840 [Mycobacterium riyadhense]VTO99628.1 hypothetical protein BIN_B_03100 [Mycobacterium riyadhense]